jgi:peptide/nickel transport system substrate-binding protein
MHMRTTLTAMLALPAALLSGCEQPRTGPVVVSAIGGAPRLVNPNLEPLSPASALLIAATAPGLVRFDNAGQIEPALAQSWIVSDDGLRYTFRLARLRWPSGGVVTSQQVVARLRAALSGASRNPLKPQLGAIDSIEAMTDNVLEISLKAPRPNFLQLLAQPEMAIVRGGAGLGPYAAARQSDGSILLTQAAEDEEDGDSTPAMPELIIRGETAPLAVARFVSGGSDLVTGGTLGDLPVARAGNPAANALRFDPAAGLFGIEFVRDRGLTADVTVRRALSMAVDRDALVAALDVPGWQPRLSVAPAGLAELPQPALPDWSELPLAERQRQAAATIASLGSEERPTIRVGMPAGPGYRVVFAYLSRDWRAIGVDAEPVSMAQWADVRLIDVVAPTTLASWYLRHVACAGARPCAPAADALIAAARMTRSEPERRRLLAEADVAITEANLFIPIAPPVRWFLVSRRLAGFQPNVFAQHLPASLLVRRR